MSDYSMAPADRVSSLGGAVHVIISSNKGQGNDGTSLPCREVFVTSGFTTTETGNPGFVRMNIGAVASSILGIIIPGPTVSTVTLTAGASTLASPPALQLKIDDVSKLYFWAATDGMGVDILYRK